MIDRAPEVNKAQVLEIYRKIANQAARIDKIIKNIRAFAKRRPTTLECVSLNSVFSDTMELGRLIEKKYAGVQVVYELPAVVPDVICDPVQIMQILMNLIRNAAVRTKPSRSVRRSALKTLNCLSAITAPESAIR